MKGFFVYIAQSDVGENKNIEHAKQQSGIETIFFVYMGLHPIPPSKNALNRFKIDFNY